jgi:hypothetical protein
MPMRDFDLSMLFASTAEEEAFLRQAELRRLIPNYRPSKLSQKDADDHTLFQTVKHIHDLDIILGRSANNPGNVLFRKVIYSNRPYFQSLQENESRRIGVDAVIQWFESKGTRFLEPITKNGTIVYREVPYAVSVLRS